MPIFELPGAIPDVSAAAWIAPSATLAGRIVLAEEVSVWFGAVMRAEDEPITIGARSNVQDNCVLHVDPGFPLSIGEDCTIGHGAIVHGCSIGSNSLIGMGAIVLNGARIGRNCLIGAHSLVGENKVIPDGSLVLGAPGKVVRELDAMAIANLRRSAASYVARARLYRSGLKAHGEPA